MPVPYSWVIMHRNLWGITWRDPTTSCLPVEAPGSFSPLSVDDFIKKSSLISFSREALEDLYKDVAEFARAEGLEAHARSVEVRFEKE